MTHFGDRNSCKFHRSFFPGIDGISCGWRNVFQGDLFDVLTYVIYTLLLSGHALGFYHEQSRPDRDNYVTIVWDNIVEGKFGKN